MCRVIPAEVAAGEIMDTLFGKRFASGKVLFKKTNQAEETNSVLVHLGKGPSGGRERLLRKRERANAKKKEGKAAIAPEGSSRHQLLFPLHADLENMMELRKILKKEKEGTESQGRGGGGDLIHKCSFCKKPPVTFSRSQLHGE